MADDRRLSLAELEHGAGRASTCWSRRRGAGVAVLISAFEVLVR
jgi:hypothetical protein